MTTLRLLFLGDIVGRSAREKVALEAEKLRKRFSLDGIFVNAENAASGFGISPTIADTLFRSGIDGITLGNHAFDKREIYTYLAQKTTIVRPANYPSGTPGLGASVISLRSGHRILLVNLLGRVFMNPVDDPFRIIDEILDDPAICEGVSAILVDFHGEATSEKQAMGHHLDGRASLVIGTHTHVPTSDYRVLPKGTAYCTDIGMCGNYDSILGMEKNEPLHRFINGLPSGRFKPQLDNVTLSGVLAEVDLTTGLSLSIEPFRSGGSLSQAIPHNGIQS